MTWSGMTWSGMTLVRHDLVRDVVVRHELVRHDVVRHDLVRHDVVRHDLVRRPDLVRHRLPQRPTEEVTTMTNGAPARAERRSGLGHPPADHAAHGLRGSGRGGAVRHRRPLAARSPHGPAPAVGALGGSLRRSARRWSSTSSGSARRTRFSMGDLVLGAGLLLATPRRAGDWPRCSAAAVTLVVHRSQRGIKLVFNLAQYALGGSAGARSSSRVLTGPARARGTGWRRCSPSWSSP